MNSSYMRLRLTRNTSSKAAGPAIHEEFRFWCVDVWCEISPVNVSVKSYALNLILAFSALAWPESLLKFEIVTRAYSLLKKPTARHKRNAGMLERSRHRSNVD